jgi:hypothetical protein
MRGSRGTLSRISFDAFRHCPGRIRPEFDPATSSEPLGVPSIQAPVANTMESTGSGRVARGWNAGFKCSSATGWRGRCGAGGLDSTGIGGWLAPLSGDQR